MVTTQTLTPTQFVPDGPGLDLTAQLATPTGTVLQFSNTGREILLVAAPAAASTTVASGSNGGEISTIASWSAPSAGVLDVASSAAFPSGGGTVTVATSSTTATITYTGTGSGTLTGCAYVSGSATGTVATSGAVTLVSPNVTVDFGALVDGQTVSNFTSVVPTTGHTVAFGPFHSIIDQSGTNQVQVTLSSTSGVTVALLQGVGVY